MRTAFITALCTVGLVACFGDTPVPDFNPDATLNLTADENGNLCTDDGVCTEAVCGDCADPQLQIDETTGDTQTVCADATDAATDCGGPIAQCQVIDIPAVPCVVCAFLNANVFYSSCVPSDELYCEEVDRWGGGGSVPVDPGTATDPDPDTGSDGFAAPPPPCEQGGTFPAGDGCNFCTCDDTGAVTCTEMACGDGCIPGEARLADDGCNICECDADGNTVCTEMACGGTCTRCYDALGDLVIDECGNDCSQTACPQVLCAPGFIQRVLPGDCCESCVPVDDCSDVACPADAEFGFIGCPDGHQAITTCCGTRCEPVSCDGVVCPALAGDFYCPEGTWLDSAAPNCCPTCRPDSDVCQGDDQCGPGQICSTSYGDCETNPDCAGGPDGTTTCDASCYGRCLPGECPQDNICADGSLPQGPECWCPDNNFCPLDFVCADGTLPQGPECWCNDPCTTDPTCPPGADCGCGGDECLLDFICPDGSQPLGAECRCPGDDECLEDFVCADGSLPQGAECWCPDACPLAFVCADGSAPDADCSCPGDTGDVCYSDQDCNAGYCSVSDGDCNAPPDCVPGEPCITVCTGWCTP